MVTDTERREVEAWGLDTIIALRDLSCGEWEQPVSLFLMAIEGVGDAT